MTRKLKVLVVSLVLAACGQDGAAGSGDEATLPPEGGLCPAGDGPAMVRIPEGCIDSTEVTRAQYQAWLEAGPGTDGRASACDWNQSFEPTCGWPPGSNPDKPVVCVDWCDAAAYCEDAGKRLCGAIGGGAYDWEAYDDPLVSEWHAACSSGGSYDYTYGNDHDPAACRGADEDMWAWVDVGSLSGCQSPDAAYAGVFDLSGNVLEWEDACAGSGSAADACRVRGGGFNYGGPGLRCDMGGGLEWARSEVHVGLGFRCCATPEPPE
ncbi:protein kinase domain protein [Plesiocystis pacifica SIR-1]|uniref:Protein kinase domain protein n=1 Tax=Plesiocystis pacifica SIR-1 TaxID=391625 RepID=A6G129_9BACT|nr:SUMF1/EgtB/PvdO family nonheme iron enzyme [Plesiocystis pacifica]EDM80324.1 protein kinase domain protein [Plesiocystis pacifica SIR-1]